MPNGVNSEDDSSDQEQSMNPDKNELSWSQIVAVVISIVSIVLAGASFYRTFLYDLSSVVATTWNVRDLDSGIQSDPEPRFLFQLSADFMFANVGTLPVAISNIEWLVFVPKKGSSVSREGDICSERRNIYDSLDDFHGYDVEWDQRPFVIEAGHIETIELKFENWAYWEDIGYSLVSDPDRSITFQYCFRFTIIDSEGIVYRSASNMGIGPRGLYEIDEDFGLSGFVDSTKSVDLIKIGRPR